MKVMRYFVCLLALAGGVWVFVSHRAATPDSFPLSQSIQYVDLRSSATLTGLSVPRRDVTMPITGNGSAGLVVPASQKLPARASAQLSIPVTFEPNVGQANDDVEFIGRGKA